MFPTAKAPPPPRLLGLRRCRLAANHKRLRAFLFHFGICRTRIDHIRRTAVADIDTASVLMSVWRAGLKSRMRDRATLHEISSLSDPLDYEGLPATSPTALATATGIPRESVRRKLKELEMGGMLVNLGQGFYKLPQPKEADSSNSFTALFPVIEPGVAFVNDALADECLLVDTEQGERPLVGDLRGYRLVVAPEKSRIYLYYLTTILLRMDKLRRESPFAEADRGSVLLAFWLQSIEPALRDWRTRDRYGNLAESLDFENLSSSTPTAIAAMTGMTRETARRKLMELQAGGLANYLGKGHYRLRRPEQEFNAPLAHALKQLVTECMRFINAGINDEVLCFEEIDKNL